MLKEKWEIFLRFVLISNTFVILVSIYYLYFLSLTGQAPCPAPASSPCCGLLLWFIACASGAGWAGMAPAAAEERQCKRHSFSPAVAHIAWETLIAALGELQARVPSGYKHGVRRRAAMGAVHHRAGGKPPSLALA